MIFEYKPIVENPMSFTSTWGAASFKVALPEYHGVMGIDWGISYPSWCVVIEDEY